MTKKAIAIELTKWFNSTTNLQNRWQDPIGEIIVKELTKTKNWKKAPSGNPRVGFEAMGQKGAE